jgi:hypothetical protein
MYAYMSIEEPLIIVEKVKEGAACNWKIYMVYIYGLYKIYTVCRCTCKVCKECTPSKTPLYFILFHFRTMYG